MYLYNSFFKWYAQADNQSNCEIESNALRGTSFFDPFVKDCLESASWSTTLDIEANAWDKCKEENKLSNYEECLNTNRIYKSSMIASFDCYYKELKVLSSTGYNKYRYAKSDALFYGAKETKMYMTYSMCLNGIPKPENVDDSVKFYECVAKHIYEEASLLVLREWKKSPNYNQDFDECKKAIRKELVTSSLLSAPFPNDNFLPYIKCAFERMGLLENNCLYLDRTIKAFKKTNDSNEDVLSCFNKAIGKNDFELLNFWNCLFENQIFNYLELN